MRGKFYFITTCIFLTFYCGLIEIRIRTEPSTMNALVVPIFGPPKVLETRVIPVPKPGSQQILVKVEAAGINPVDAYIRSGTYSDKPDLPAVLGKEIAGTVEELGEDIITYKKYDRVFCGVDKGGYAEYAVANETDCYYLPEQLSFSQGATLFVIYFAAYKAVIRKAHTKTNETILIHGASGSLGTSVVQIAKTVGAVVVATVGEQGFEKLMKEAGADHVIYHTTPYYLEEAIKFLDIPGFNVIVEILSSADFMQDRIYLAPYGRLIVMGVRTRLPETVKFSKNGVSKEGVILGVSLTKSTRRQQQLAASFVLNGINAGFISPLIAEEYSFQQASMAHHKIAYSRSARGKLVFLPWKTKSEN